MIPQVRRIVVSLTTGLLLASALPQAQNTLGPTPTPTITADRETWFLSGRPITWSGNIYYAAGAQIHFNPYEMVRSGSFEGIPLYVRTTIEPGSIVFVPLAGGVMQPYERRRAGELAGTTGSSAPAFPVILPAQQDTAFARAGLGEEQAPSIRPGMATVGMVGEVAGTGEVLAPEPLAVATVGAVRAPRAVANAPVVPRVFMSAERPKGLNGVFVLYGGTRWFSDGPAVEYSPSRFVQVGSYGKFPVYEELGKKGVIYIPHIVGEPGLLSVYRAR